MSNNIIAAIVLCAFNFIITAILLRLSRSKPWSAFVKIYGIGTGIKLALIFTACLVLIFVYGFNPKNFMLAFGITYFVSLMLEIFYINYQKKSINLYDIEKTKRNN